MIDDDEMSQQVLYFGAELILRVAQEACVISGHGLGTRESGLSKRSLEICWEGLSAICIGSVMIRLYCGTELWRCEFGLYFDAMEEVQRPALPPSDK